MLNRSPRRFFSKGEGDPPAERDEPPLGGDSSESLPARECVLKEDSTLAWGEPPIRINHPTTMVSRSVLCLRARSLDSAAPSLHQS